MLLGVLVAGPGCYASDSEALELNGPCSRSVHGGSAFGVAGCSPVILHYCRLFGFRRHGPTTLIPSQVSDDRALIPQHRRKAVPALWERERASIDPASHSFGGALRTLAWVLI